MEGPPVVDDNGHVRSGTGRRSSEEDLCPLRPGEPCGRCQASGPETCGLVYLIMTDPELRQRLERIYAEREALPESPPEA